MDQEKSHDSLYFFSIFYEMSSDQTDVTEWKCVHTLCAAFQRQSEHSQACDHNANRQDPQMKPCRMQSEMENRSPSVLRLRSTEARALLSVSENEMTGSGASVRR